ncbi:MAG TPA: insulinase family protein, partial [Chromatiales bacterium]|nr:insulinase family protein [Chromatiales bacterium]
MRDTRPRAAALRTLVAACAVLACAAAAAAPGRVHEWTLANGLKLVVKEDHRAPVVVSQIWYRVGSGDEPAGLTGISHLLEHMMFKGTPRHPAGEFSRIIAEQGGRENAFTGRD